MVISFHITWACILENFHERFLFTPNSVLLEKRTVKNVRVLVSITTLSNMLIC